MKKIISLVLVFILTFSALAVSAAAASEYETHYITFNAGENLKIVPANGYSQYVTPGDDFKFYVEVDEGYSDNFVIVEINMVVTEPDTHGIYTISEVRDDMTVKAYLSVEEESSNLFSSLILLVRGLLEWIKNAFESLFSFAA